MGPCLVLSKKREEEVNAIMEQAIEEIVQTAMSAEHEDESIEWGWLYIEAVIQARKEN